MLQHGGDYHKGRAESRDLGFLVPPWVLAIYLNVDGQLIFESLYFRMRNIDYIH